jgi:hypothetical protein
MFSFCVTALIEDYVGTMIDGLQLYEIFLKPFASPINLGDGL